MDTMLDFKVELALGEERLTEAEWRQLMTSEEGLVNLKGKWVEIDREKLSEALAHWKRVEEEAGEDGISFIEGMRILAGAPSDLGSDGALREKDRDWAFVNAGLGFPRSSQACANRKRSIRPVEPGVFAACFAPTRRSGTTGFGS
jgi:hypothetical protein